MVAAPRHRTAVASVAPYILTVGAMVLAWQILIQPLMQRTPVAIAIRIAPTSPLVLSRAAEAELAAGRNANAAALGRDALARSPFDVRALRIVGLTEARAGRVDAADEMLTLAGNWSLRDDPTHAWLVEHRLREGDYASAFAHADTLIRRREDVRPQVFRLFTIAAIQDPGRSLPVVAHLLAARPSWRQDYLESLYAATDALPVAAGLAILLQASPAPLTNTELQRFYWVALDKGQIKMVKTIRARLNRPPASAVTNGEFDDPAAPEPFQWQLVQKAGATSVITSDDSVRGNIALRVEYDGYSTAVVARQRVFLAAGRYRLIAKFRTEMGEPVNRLAWTINCASNGSSLLSASAVTKGLTPKENWAASAAEFSIAQGCPSQWLELQGRPLDSRAPMAVWFDQIVIVRLDPGTS